MPSDLISKQWFLRWVGAAYANPTVADEILGSAPRGRTVSVLFTSAYCAVLLLAALIVTRFVLFGVLGLPILEEVRWGLAGRVLFDMRELSVGFVVALPISIVIWLLLARATPANSFGPAIITGITFGIAGSVAHAVAGGARALVALFGILVIGGFILSADHMARRFERRSLAWICVPAFGLAGAIAAYVLSRSFGGAAIAVRGGLLGDITLGIAVGFAFGFTISSARGEQWMWIDGLWWSVALGVAAVISGSFVWGRTDGLIFGSTFGAATAICLLRAYYIAVHPFFLWPKVRGAWFPLHPAHWDRMCSVPFPGLDHVLIDYSKCAPRLASSEIDRLCRDRSQEEQGTRARALLVIEQAAGCKNLAELGAVPKLLPDRDEFTPARSFLLEVLAEEGQFGRAFMVDRKRSAATAVARLLADASVEIVPKFARSEFQKALQHWRSLAQGQVAGLHPQHALAHVFKYGGAVDRRTDAFVPRQEVTEDLMRLIRDPRGRTAILLYGRKRIGKSTVIMNLEGLIPEDITCAYIDMQNAQALDSMGSLLALISEECEQTLSGLEHCAEERMNLSLFQAKLVDIDSELKRVGRRLIIAIDEVAILDRKMANWSQGSDLLAVVRQGINSLTEIVWLFISSNQLTEFAYPHWAAYFTEVHTVEVLPFRAEETRRLLCYPLAYSDRGSLKVDPTQWGGEVGIETIHKESGGWPSVIQLVAQVVIDLLDRRHLDSVDEKVLDAALQKAVVQGKNFFDLAIRNECHSPAEWNYLRNFATQIELSAAEDDVMVSLWRRRLINRVNEKYVLSVPIVRRWLREWYP